MILFNLAKQKIYHKDVYWPDYVVKSLPVGSFRVTYSLHALNEANADKYGIIQEINRLDLKGECFIEAYFEDNRPIKFLYRHNLDNEVDTCLVLKIENGEIFIITQWLNKSNDKHESLNKGKYQNGTTK